MKRLVLRDVFERARRRLSSEEGAVAAAKSARTSGISDPLRRPPRRHAFELRPDLEQLERLLPR